MKRMWQFCCIFLIYIFCFSFGMIPVTAASHNALGSKPLYFESCSLEDGTHVNSGTAVSVQPKFTLQFDKNVVDTLVWLDNRNCVEILSSDGNQVPADVTKIDDTVDPTHKQEIFITPQKALNRNSLYSLFISPKLTAKNGVTLSNSTGGKGITIKFVTQNGTGNQSTSGQTDSGFPYRILTICIAAVFAIGIFIFIVLKIRRKPPKEN